MDQIGTRTLRRLRIWQEVDTEVREAVRCASDLRPRVEVARHTPAQDRGIRRSLTALLEHVGQAERLAISLDAWKLREGELVPLTEWFANLTAYYLVNVALRDDLGYAEFDLGFERHSVTRIGPAFLHRLEHRTPAGWVTSGERMVTI